MKISELLTNIKLLETLKEEFEVKGLQNDSRRIVPGDLFIAYPGAATDGRKYIKQAIQAGAVGILYEPKGFSFNVDEVSTTPLIPVTQLNEQLAAIASQFYHYPSNRVGVIGVTGTNGKTTIAYQLAQAYELLGKRSAYIGTIGQGNVQALKPLLNTTPDALCLQHLLHDYETAGAHNVCMEVSSHALSLGRVDGIEFVQAIYTNLSHDHLDFHGTFEAYAEAKALLFSFASLQSAVINHDDAHSQQMQKNVPKNCQLITYGIKSGADVRAVSWQMNMTGSTIEVVSPWGKHTLQSQSLGRFNLYNTLAVFASLMAREVASEQAIIEVMGQLKASPGRMEIVAQKPCVIVDYAHTPDALENVLQTLVSLKPQKLWVVFGCGGDRDRTKRPVMGKIASQYADFVVLTNDNPRTEDPDLILQEIRQGMPSDSEIDSICDRREAIHHALRDAGENDIVLIAGKGHEDYQIIGQQKFMFSDQTVVREFLNNN